MDGDIAKRQNEMPYIQQTHQMKIIMLSTTLLAYWLVVETLFEIQNEYNDDLKWDI
jgi:hypothetical protein